MDIARLYWGVPLVAVVVHDDRVVYLFAGAVGALTGLVVVPGPVEWHELVALALAVVHFVALFDVDLVQLDGAAGLAGHEDLGRHQLSCNEAEGKKKQIVRPSENGEQRPRSAFLFHRRFRAVLAHSSAGHQTGNKRVF